MALGQELADQRGEQAAQDKKRSASTRPPDLHSSSAQRSTRRPLACGCSMGDPWLVCAAFVADVSMTKKRQRFGYASSFVATDGTTHARCKDSTQTYALFGHLQDLVVEAFFDVVALQTCYVKLPFAPGMLVVIFPNADDIWYLCALWRRVRKPGRKNVNHSQCKAVLASLATEECREVVATKIVPCCASGSRASVTAAKAQKLMSLFEVYKANEIGKYQTEVIATDGDAKAAVVSTRLRAHSLKRASTALGPRSATPPPTKVLIMGDSEEEEEDDDMAAAHATAQAQRALEQTEKKLALERKQASADRSAAREREAALLAQLREAQKAPAHTAAHAAASTPLASGCHTRRCTWPGSRTRPWSAALVARIFLGRGSSCWELSCSLCLLRQSLWCPLWPRRHSCWPTWRCRSWFWRWCNPLDGELL